MKNQNTTTGAGISAAHIVNAVASDIIGNNQRMTPKLHRQVSLILADKIVALKAELNGAYSIAYNLAKFGRGQ